MLSYFFINKIRKKEDIQSKNDYIHEKLEKVQNKTAFLLDYGFNSNNLSVSEETIGKVIAGMVLV